MIEQARSSTPQDGYPNLTFRKSSAESLTFLENESVDLVVAGCSQQGDDVEPEVASKDIISVDIWFN